MTPTTLHHAFATADAIHALIGAGDFKLLEARCMYLTLVATHAGGWAATFDYTEEYDWYEKGIIGRYPHSARAADPATAIMEAAVKLIEDLNLDIAV